MCGAIMIEHDLLDLGEGFALLHESDDDLQQLSLPSDRPLSSNQVSLL